MRRKIQPLRLLALVFGHNIFNVFDVPSGSEIDVSYRECYESDLEHLALVSCLSHVVKIYLPRESIQDEHTQEAIASASSIPNLFTTKRREPHLKATMVEVRSPTKTIATLAG